MRKLFLLLLLSAVWAHARQITPREAAAIANDVLGTTGSVRQAPGRNVSDADVQDYYVFNTTDASGFVIVAGDDRAPRVLGYGDSGSFDFANIPPQLSALLEQFSDELHALPEDAPTHHSWNAPLRAASYLDGALLLQTANYGQGAPYNLLCPEIEGERALTGCVATAIAIIMEYNKYPRTARGSHSWYSNGTPMNFDFDTVTLDYALIRKDYSVGTYSEAEALEVSKMMQMCGAAVNMQYGTAASGAITSIVGHSLTQHFAFSPKCQYISAAVTDEDQLQRIIREQLEADHPMIFSGISDGNVGHAFVCDGINAENMCHINWGWDGTANGYFDYALMGGFNNNFGMIINCYDNGDHSLYSRVWIDAGYLWATSMPGFNVSVEDIRPNEPFTASVQMANFPNDFDGLYTLALVDEDDNIVEIAPEINQHQVVGNHDWDLIGYSWCGFSPLEFNNVVFTSDIRPGMRVQAVTKEKSEQQWRFVLGSIEAPSSTPVTGNIPLCSDVTVTFHNCGDNVILETQSVGTTRLLIGQLFPTNYLVKQGVAYMLVDGVYVTNGSDLSGFSFNFSVDKPTYQVDVYYNSYSDLLEKHITTTEPGSLMSQIAAEEMPLVWRLTVAGPISTDELMAIPGSFYSLQYLDLSEATIVDEEGNVCTSLPPFFGTAVSLHSTVGSTVWGVEIVKLPTNLTEIGAYALPYRCMDFLEIPEHVSSFGRNAAAGYGGDKLTYLSVRNPEPAELIEDSGTLNMSYDYRAKTTLFVPVGSKQKYEESPLWSGFKEVRETDVPFVGEYVLIGNERYLILSDFAAYTGSYRSDNQYVTIVEDVEYDGTLYPVTSFSAGVNHMNTLYLDNSHFIDSNLSAGVLFTKNLYPTFTSWSGAILAVPGACADNFSAFTGGSVEEMWRYTINKADGIVSIAPHLAEVVVDKVVINGEETLPTGEKYYYDTDGTSPQVEVTYTLNGCQQMTTTYTAEYNALLPDDITLSILDVQPLTDAPIEVYTPQGIRVMQAATAAELRSLPAGIYILRQGSQATKLHLQ